MQVAAAAAVPGMFKRLAVMPPEPMAATKMPMSRAMPWPASSLKMMPRERAMPMVGPSPGMTPTKKPQTVPSRRNTHTMGSAKYWAAAWGRKSHSENIFFLPPYISRR